MAYNTNYSGALMPGEANDTLIAAMKEIIELSHYEGVESNWNGFEAIILR